MRLHPALLRTCVRPGKVLILFVLLLPILVGWVGLVIDTGLLLAGYRQAQNAADAAATAAALDKFRGADDATATVTANKFVQQYNGLSNSPTLVLNAGNANAVNIPPIQGPYAGNAQYVEVILTVPVQTLFIQVLGINPNQTSVARAVAG